MDYLVYTLSKKNIYTGVAQHIEKEVIMLMHNTYNSLSMICI